VRSDCDCSGLLSGRGGAAGHVNLISGTAGASS